MSETRYAITRAQIQELWNAAKKHQESEYELDLGETVAFMNLAEVSSVGGTERMIEEFEKAWGYCPWSDKAKKRVAWTFWRICWDLISGFIRDSSWVNLEISEDDVTFILQRGIVLASGQESEEEARKHTRDQLENLVKSRELILQKAVIDKYHCQGCGQWLDPGETEPYGSDRCHVVAVYDGDGNPEPAPCGPLTGYSMVKQ